MVSGAIWALAAGLGAWVAPIYGMAALFFISMLLFPLTQAVLRLLGRPARLSPGNTLGQLATQIAFTVPAGFIVVAAATLYNPNWFFPAAMVIVGAHYLPFVFLYGMPHFAVLAVLLIAGGALLGRYGPDSFALGGWISAAVFVIFAFVGRSAVLREERAQPARAIERPAAR
jgi:hypothetical protein